MRLNLLFGFLGSGKTTLVRRMLEERASDVPMAVIVNEFGDVSVDGPILEGNAVNMVELNSGCVCCTLKGSLLNAIEELEERAGVRQIVVEATGVAQPADMLDTLDDPTLKLGLDLGPLITVVDAAKFTKIRTMLGEFYTKQVANADVILLNKTDLLDADGLEAVREQIRELNPDASVVYTEQCDVDPAMVLDGSTRVARLEHVTTTGHHDHDHDHDHDHGHDHDHEHPAPADSFVLDADGDWSRAAIEAFYRTLPDDVWRSKGFLTVDGEPSLLQYTMGQLEVTAAEPRPHAHLVFIGRPLDRDAIANALAGARGESAS